MKGSFTCPFCRGNPTIGFSLLQNIAKIVQIIYNLKIEPRNLAKYHVESNVDESQTRVQRIQPVRNTNRNAWKLLVKVGE